MNLKHPGTVSKQGKFIPDDPATFRADFEARAGRRVTVAVAQERKDRTHRQNAYYWAVCVRLIGEWMGEDDAQAVHDALRHKFLSIRYTRAGLDVFKSTAALSTVEFSQYVEQVKQWAAEQGVIIPDANQIEQEE